MHKRVDNLVLGKDTQLEDKDTGKDTSKAVLEEEEHEDGKRLLRDCCL